jgi:lipoyl(octanoyl) transferase
MIKIEFQDLGLIDFRMAWEHQEQIFNNLINYKTGKGEEDAVEKNGVLIFCEHPHVYTIGKSGSEENLLIDTIQLQSKDASFYRINRGGDITYHGPGQLVCYPILDLELFGMGIKKYVESIEEVIIQALAEFDFSCARLKGATGVWLDTDKLSARKIAAIGVRSSKYVTMHGFALNVNTDLSYFNYINPCGFIDKTVTSVAKETGVKVDMEKIKETLLRKFIDVFNIRFISKKK